jgi:DNA-binding NarL/FixJ family response regulator
VTAVSRIRRVLIVDEHPIVRQGLLRVVQNESDLLVCAEIGTASAARTAIEEVNPDVLVCDIDEKHAEGIDLVRYVRAHHPMLPILVLSTQDETIYAERMLALGANGYINKQASSAELLASLRCVLDGHIYLSDTIRDHMIQKFAGTPSSALANPVDRLSTRELQVLSLLGEGRSTREAAHSLHVSIKTVESHRQRIKRKLNLKNSVQLLRYAVLTRSGASMS